MLCQAFERAQSPKAVIELPESSTYVLGLKRIVDSVECVFVIFLAMKKKVFIEHCLLNK